MNSKKFNVSRFLTKFLVACIIVAGCAEDQDSKHKKRIIGGRRAKSMEYPFIVSIADQSMEHYCGGSLIDLNHILTAAHCFLLEDGSIENPGEIRLAAGETNIQTRKSQFLQTPSTYAVILHPKYDFVKKINDIAMIKLEGSVKRTDGVHAIAIASHRPPVGTTCTVAGWGLTDVNAVDASKILLKVDIRIEPESSCDRLELGEVHPETQICAGVLAGGKDSCRGDSGGPLVCQGKLAGVVSFGYDCGKQGFAAIYTDVSKYKEWIQTVLKWDGKKPMPRTRIISKSNSIRLTNCHNNCVLIIIASLILHSMLSTKHCPTQ